MILLCTECSFTVSLQKTTSVQLPVLDSVAAGYKKLRNRIGKLTNDGEINQELVKEYKEKFIDVVGNDLNTASGITLVYDVLKEDTNEATKLAIINDFEKFFHQTLQRVL